MCNIENDIKKLIQEELKTNNDIILTKAPGRINLIGEHTDYNQGLVLPAAINKFCYFGLKPNNKNEINFSALDLNDRLTINILDLQKSDKPWANFLIGILLEFKHKGISIKGFDCALTSQVPIGAGMSSSSAMECSMLTALNKFFTANYNNWDLIEISQRSNHNFLGIKGGILDQFSSLFGQEGKCMFMDCSDRSYEYFTIPESDFSWLLINSNVKHDHLTSGYNVRVQECKQALSAIKEKHPTIRHLSQFRTTEKLSGIIFPNKNSKLRAEFIVEENSRVRSFTSALASNDMQRCGELLYASHQGLSQKYEVSCPELDLLVELTKEFPDVLGARMMGGGFGGCTINLLHEESIIDFKNFVSSHYKNAFNIDPEFYAVHFDDGAQLMYCQ